MCPVKNQSIDERKATADFATTMDVIIETYIVCYVYQGEWCFTRRMCKGPFISKDLYLQISVLQETHLNANIHLNVVEL